MYPSFYHTWCFSTSLFFLLLLTPFLLSFSLVAICSPSTTRLIFFILFSSTSISFVEIIRSTERCKEAGGRSDVSQEGRKEDRSEQDAVNWRLLLGFQSISDWMSDKSSGHIFRSLMALLKEFYSSWPCSKMCVSSSVAASSVCVMWGDVGSLVPLSCTSVRTPEMKPSTLHSQAGCSGSLITTTLIHTLICMLFFIYNSALQKVSQCSLSTSCKSVPVYVQYESHSHTTIHWAKIRPDLIENRKNWDKLLIIFKLLE